MRPIQSFIESVVRSMDVSDCAALAAIVAVAWVSHLRLQLRNENRRLRQTLKEADAKTDFAKADASAAKFGRRLAASLLPGGTRMQLDRFLAVLAPHPAEDFAVLSIGDRQPLLSRGRVPDELPPTVTPNAVHVAESAGRWVVSFGGGVRVIASRFGEEHRHEFVLRCVQEVADAVVSLTNELASEVREADELAVTRGMLQLRSACDASADSTTGVLNAYLDTLLSLTQFSRVSLFVETPEGRATRAASAGVLGHAGVVQTAEEHERRLLAAPGDGMRVLDAGALRAAGVTTLAASAAIIPIRHGDRRCGTLLLTSGDHGTPCGTQHRLLEWVGGHLGEQLGHIRDRISVQRQATTDALTGLSNRAELSRAIDAAVAASTPDQPCSVILFDLDHFKNVNDIHGHAAGDAALVHVADTLRAVASQMRADDRPVLARYGGEELLMLLPRAPIAAALRIAEQVRSDLETRPFTFGGRQIPLRVSAGVSVAPDHAGSAADLLAVADGCLYEAKRRGRNRVESPAAFPVPG